MFLVLEMADEGGGKAALREMPKKRRKEAPSVCL
jgi:hypothetical protein